MNSTILLQKLIAIEKSIGMADNGTIRQLVYEAEDCLLEIQRERAQSFFLDSWRTTVPRLHVVGEVPQNH
jgi:hypothetical protein